MKFTKIYDLDCGLVQVTFNATLSQSAHCDKYGRPTEFEDFQETEILTVTVLEGTLPCDREIYNRIYLDTEVGEELEEHEYFESIRGYF